ncbi:MAG: SH3 domain-containing protein [Clostridia bacterium]|nr:SH3 domain-containing protein [Clostridia bacterium]
MRLITEERIDSFYMLLGKKMKRIILIGLILFCMATVACADLGPVVVDNGEYKELFGGQVYAELSDKTTVAMVEGGEWEAYLGLSSDAREDKSKELSWELKTADGNILAEGKQNEYGSADIALPESLEVGKEYNLVYTYGEDQETIPLNVVTAEEAGLDVNRGDLEIVGFKDGDVLKPVKYSDYEYITFVYNQCGFGLIHVTFEGVDTSHSTRYNVNCTPTGDGKNQVIEFTINFFHQGERYRVTLEQGGQTVSREFVVGGETKTTGSSSSVRTSSSRQVSKAEKEENVANAVSSATQSVISKINYNRGTKKKNTTIKTEKGSVPKSFYYNVKEANGGFPPTITDAYLNDELDDSLSSAVKTLSDEVEYLKKQTKEYPDELYVFPEYTYTLKRDDYLLTVVPFFAKKDGNLFGDKMYLYCIQQSKGEYKSGGKKYSLRRMGFVISEGYNVQSVLQNAFSDSTDKVWRDFVNRYNATISPELMEKAVPANEIDNLSLPIGQVVIRKDSDVRVRVSPEMDAEVVGTAKKGATYLLYEVEENGWLKIKLEDGSIGYIGRWLCAKYIDSSAEQTEEPEPEKTEEKEVPAQTASEQTGSAAASGKSDSSDPSISESTGVTKGILTKNKVGLREKPEKNGRKIRLLDKGAKVDVIGKTSNGEGLWYYVQYNKDKGYLSSEMLEVTNASDVPEL